MKWFWYLLLFHQRWSFVDRKVYFCKILSGSVRYLVLYVVLCFTFYLT